MTKIMIKISIFLYKYFQMIYLKFHAIKTKFTYRTTNPCIAIKLCISQVLFFATNSLQYSGGIKE